MFCLRIDFVMLGAKLAQMNQSAVSNGDVMTWLLDRGFQLVRGGWLASAAQVRMLQTGEIIVSYPINDSPAAP